MNLTGDWPCPLIHTQTTTKQIAQINSSHGKLLSREGHFTNSGIMSCLWCEDIFELSQDGNVKIQGVVMKERIDLLGSWKVRASSGKCRGADSHWMGRAANMGEYFYPQEMGHELVLMKHQLPQDLQAVWKESRSASGRPVCTNALLKE